MNTGFANVDAAPGADATEPSSEDCHKQVRRILESNTFRTAATLQSLLQFITAKTISGEASSLKEYTIGVEALGRRPDFDPRVDPIVRVQSHRLRVKLKEYYESEGLSDPVVIQFPKGHYVPVFEMAIPEGTKVPASQTEIGRQEISEPASPDTPTAHGRLWRWGWIAGPVVAAIILVFAAYWLGRWHAEKQAGAASGAGPYDPEVIAFWTRFLGNDTSPVIAYPDAVFLLDDSNDLFRFRHGAIDSRGAPVDPHVAREFAANPDLVSKAGQLFYDNGYTGTGELESAAMLASLFGRMGLKPILKSSRDVLPEDLSQHNVILFGSPFQNPAVAQLMTAGDFRFSNPDQHHEQWRAQILNARPAAGESAVYGTERDPSSKVLTTDFGVITMTRSGASGRWVAILGGLDTTGTEGTAIVATSKAGVERLTKALADQSGGSREMLPFQALVRVDIAKGYLVMGADMVTLHPIRGAHPVIASQTAPAR